MLHGQKVFQKRLEPKPSWDLFNNDLERQKSQRDEVEEGLWSQQEAGSRTPWKLVNDLEFL